MACCLAKCCGCAGGATQGCTSNEAVTMNLPTIVTSKYEDQCSCRTCCSYPNRLWPVLLAQLLTAAAAGLSSAATFECRLISVPNTPGNGIDNFTIQTLYNGTIPDDYIYKPYRSMGFINWEGIDGSCANDKIDDSYNDDDSFAFDSYRDFVGNEFERLFNLGAVVASLGLFGLLWICLLSCMAHTRRYRTVLVALLSIILPVLQSMTFRVLGTDFCQEKNCVLDKFGRTTVLAIILYFIAGILLLIGTRDFPGNPYKEQKPIIPINIRYYFGQRSETVASDIDTHDNINRINTQYNTSSGSPASVVEMVNCNNGVADAIEIPVESEFIDRTLIDTDAVPTTDVVAHPTTPEMNTGDETFVSTSDGNTGNLTGTTITTPSDSISKV